MNINNPMHIKPKLVSNNLGTLETNGNFKLTEETIKESQEQARIAKEQLERETGKKIVSNKNAKEIRKLNSGEKQ